jgi:hypothetical protein
MRSNDVETVLGTVHMNVIGYVVAPPGDSNQPSGDPRTVPTSPGNNPER